MKSAVSIAYRQLTAGDFFNISKPSDHHNKGGGKPGGGQGYIDFSGIGTPLSKWNKFFDLVSPINMKGGPAWDIEVHSLGLKVTQKIRIAARTNDGKIRNISIRSQKLHSKKSNRIKAWHPNDSNFPDLPAGVGAANVAELGNIVDGLYVFIIRTSDGEYWAGYLKKGVDGGKGLSDLENLFTNKEGLVELLTPIDFDEGLSFPAFDVVGVIGDLSITNAVSSSSPQEMQNKEKNSVSVITKEKKDFLFTDLLFEDDLASDTPQIKVVTSLVRKRNKKAVNILKELYKTCQLTGDKYIFSKHDGEPYLEAHHLIPLGAGGADHPANLVVISAHVHRMLHFAKVSDIDLSKIKDNRLPITINGASYEIVWKPEHVKLIESIKVKDEEPLGSSDSE